MLMFGGSDGSSNLDVVWALVGSRPVSVPGDPDATPRRFSLAPPRPNPSRGETFVDVELAAPGRVVLDVFDTQGRRLKRIADEWLPAGHQTRAWPGDDEAGHALGTGVFFIRMQAGGFDATRRMVRVR